MGLVVEVVFGGDLMVVVWCWVDEIVLCFFVLIVVIKVVVCLFDGSSLW